MKCIIYSEKVEKVVRLKLIKTKNRVKLIAVNTDGEEVSNGSILSICDEGVHLYSGVSDKLGIKMDTTGFVKVIKGATKRKE